MSATLSRDYWCEGQEGQWASRTRKYHDHAACARVVELVTLQFGRSGTFRTVPSAASCFPILHVIQSLFDRYFSVTSIVVLSLLNRNFNRYLIVIHLGVCFVSPRPEGGDCSLPRCNTGPSIARVCAL